MKRAQADSLLPGESIIAVAHTFVALVSGEHEDEVVGLAPATDALEAVVGEIEDSLDVRL